MHAWYVGLTKLMSGNQGQSTRLVRAELDTQTPAGRVAAQDMRSLDGSRLWPTNNVLSTCRPTRRLTTCRLGSGRRGRCRARDGGGGGGGSGGGGTRVPSSDVDMDLLSRRSIKSSGARDGASGGESAAHQ